MASLEEIGQEILRIKAESEKIIKVKVLVLEFIFLAFLAEELGFGFKKGVNDSGAVPPSSAKFKTSTGLVGRTNALWDSYRSTTIKETPVTGLEFRGGTIKFTVGSNSPYADIQNEGGFIKATKRMIGFFWFQYIDTGNVFWKILALGAKKNGGIKIKKSEYFDNAWEKFLLKGYDEFVDELNKELEPLFKVFGGRT